MQNYRNFYEKKSWRRTPQAKQHANGATDHWPSELNPWVSVIKPKFVGGPCNSCIFGRGGGSDICSWYSEKCMANIDGVHDDIMPSPVRCRVSVI